MKKTIITVSILSFTLCAIGQDLSLGIKGGVNVANMKLSENGLSLDSRSRTNYHVGVFMVAMITEKLGIQPEILFSKQGSEVGKIFRSMAYNFSLIQDKNTFKLDYFNIPVLVRYNITRGFNIHAGPQLGIRRDATVINDRQSIDIHHQFRATDWSFAFGVGIDTPSGLVIGARYSLGLSNIERVSVQIYDVDYKNTNFQAYLGYKLFGKKLSNYK